MLERGQDMGVLWFGLRMTTWIRCESSRGSSRCKAAGNDASLTYNPNP